ncbi:hypothetical protein [Kribbella sp. NPDC000426]|uniref:hypothetical protein n=1 Tax=Kribbella sp. NPDC000426 TaxID=3154255 RepID=UPI003331ABF8
MTSVPSAAVTSTPSGVARFPGDQVRGRAQSVSGSAAVGATLVTIAGVERLVTSALVGTASEAPTEVGRNRAGDTTHLTATDISLCLGTGLVSLRRGR